jgi:hypothetical protein
VKLEQNPSWQRRQSSVSVQTEKPKTSSNKKYFKYFE